MRVENIIGYRPSGQSAVPSEIVGDWEAEGQIYRFHANGVYSVVLEDTYFIENNDTLHFGSEVYHRVARAAGLPGTWRKTFPEEEWLELTLGEDGLYSFKWNDGFSGDGYYTATATHLKVIERRAMYNCSGNQITIVSSSRTDVGTYSIAGDTLSIVLPEKAIVYNRYR